MPEENVVIVESPTKAKILRKYLGPRFAVLASFGHIRDLPVRDGSVRPQEDFAMHWTLDKSYKKQLDTIIQAVKGAKQVYLATDPDREGEAIAWHVCEVLKELKLLKRIDVRRISFHEITEKAVKAALAHPRDIDRGLVEAYLARRALDYLVGFTLSPVLWRKLPGSRSAGRVQSVALRLICERESEIEAFRAQKYWTIECDFTTPGNETLTARLTLLDGQKLDKFALDTEAKAQEIAARLRGLRYRVESITHKQIHRHPAPPFITSTLQQEASRKLNFTAMRTMRLAQKLYEGGDIADQTLGLITYMRTDSVQMADEAIRAVRRIITTHYPSAYLPSKPRGYKSTVKNAQEAHEAIRPTMMDYTPKTVAAYLDHDALKLYELIWKRTIASQMSSARLDQVVISITSEDGSVVLRATGSTIEFDGFMRMYQEDHDDTVDKEAFLPAVEKDAPLGLQKVQPLQHVTQPPPRYTEASLVKRLEELGLGRPSTYASILQVLQDRDYVYLTNKRFIAKDRGRLVTVFLEQYFTRYVEYTFTADLENQLDEISRDQLAWKKVLRRFWDVFSATVETMKGLRISQIIDALDTTLDAHFFARPREGDETDPRVCPGCHMGRLGLKLSRMGAFIGCSRYPHCHYKRPLSMDSGEQKEDSLATGPRILGTDPLTDSTVSLHNGPFGVYVQRDLPTTLQDKASKKKDATKPKRVTVPRFLSPSDLDLDTALQLLELPRTLGTHPTTGKIILVGIGRFGSYLKHGDQYTSLPVDEDLLHLSLARAVTLLAEAEATSKGKGGSGRGRVLGVHPTDGASVLLSQSRYGPYVKHAKQYVSLPKNVVPEEVTLEHALQLLETKKQNPGRKRPTIGKKQENQPSRQRRASKKLNVSSSS